MVTRECCLSKYTIALKFDKEFVIPMENVYSAKFGIFLYAFYREIKKKIFIPHNL